MYENSVIITHDEPKRLRNLKDHPGYDFNDLDLDFFERAAIYPVKQGRLMAIGVFRDILISVVFKPLGSEAISLISMRRASRKERKAYGKP
jgi:uncharacterized protein